MTTFVVLPRQAGKSALVAFARRLGKSTADLSPSELYNFVTKPSATNLAPVRKEDSMPHVTRFPGLEIEVDDNKGKLAFDLTKNLGETSTGKSTIIGNTSGWKQFNTPEGTFKINCLIIKMKE